MDADPNDLTDVQTVKDLLGAGATDADDTLQRLVTACSAFFQRTASRDFVSRSYTEPHDGHERDRFLLLQYPVSAVASVLVNGQPVQPRANFGDGGFVVSQSGPDAPALLIRDGRSWPKGVQNVVVSYVAGFAADTIPADLAQAVTETVVLRFRERNRIGDASKTIATGMGHETVAFTMKDLTPFAQSVLRNYTRVWA